MSRLSQEELQRDIDLLVETAKAYEAKRERARNKAAGRADRLKGVSSLSAVSTALRDAYTPGFFKALEDVKAFQEETTEKATKARVARPAARRRRP